MDELRQVLNSSGWAQILVWAHRQGPAEFLHYDTREPVDLRRLDAEDPELAAKVRLLSTLFGSGPLVGPRSVALAVCRSPIPHKVGAYHFLLQPLSDGPPDVADRILQIRSIFAEGHRGSLHAVSASSGADVEVEDAALPIWENFQRAYAQYKWVFHADLVERVLDGEYGRIFPVTAEVDSSLNCPFRCTNCAFKLPKQSIYGSDGLTVWEANHFVDRNIHMTDPNVMRRIIDALAAAGTKALVFTGGGEPMLSKCTLYGMRYAKDKGLDIVLYSNGVPVTRAAAADICSVAPNLVRISLNAGLERVHRAFHRYLAPNSRYFLRVLAAIEALAQGRLKDPRMRFGVGVVVNTHNKDTLPEVAWRLREIVLRTGGGIDFVTFRPEFDYFGGPQIDAEVVEGAMRVIRTEVRQILQGTGIELFSLPLRAEALAAPRPYDRCRANYVFGEVGPDGRMYLCCERHFMAAYEIGDLMVDGVEEIWAGRKRAGVVGKVDCMLGGGGPPVGMLRCPPACKPHPLNVLFSEIEEFRECGRMPDVRRWVGLLRRLPMPADLIV